VASCLLETVLGVLAHVFVPLAQLLATAPTVVATMVDVEAKMG